MVNSMSLKKIIEETQHDARKSKIADKDIESIITYLNEEGYIKDNKIKSDKLDMIETIAKAIFDEYYPNGYGKVTDYDNAEESHKQNLRRCAKSALDASQSLIETKQAEILKRCQHAFQRIKDLMEAQTQHGKLYDDVYHIARSQLSQIKKQKN